MATIARTLANPLLALATVATALLATATAHAAERPDPLTAKAAPHGDSRAGRPAEWRTLGLMRIRDMTPFGLGRLDMLPAHAVPAPPRTFAFELNASYQNTWALSGSVRDYLDQRGVRRGALDAVAVSDIQALPGDAYLVDGEFGVVDLTFHYRATPHTGIYVTVPWFTFQGGFLDGTIESFHEAAGFSSAGRENVPRDGFFALADLGHTSVVVGEPPAGGFGDPVLGLRYSLLSRPDHYNLVLEGAAKVSVFERERFVATGRDDFGLQLSLQRFLRRNAFYLSAAGVTTNLPTRGSRGTAGFPRSSPVGKPR